MSGQTDGKSVIYNVNGNGPRIDPWGIPVDTRTAVDLLYCTCA